MGKQPSDYQSTELDGAVQWHLGFLLRVSRPVTQATQQAIRVLSQQRFEEHTQQPLSRLMFASLRNNVLQQYDALLLRGCWAHVPMPVMVGSIVCVMQLGSFDVPHCDGCRLPLMVASLSGVGSTNGSMLELSDSQMIHMPSNEGNLIVELADRKEIEAILYCKGQTDMCQHCIALLTLNSVNTSAVYSKEMKEQVFKRK